MMETFIYYIETLFQETSLHAKINLEEDNKGRIIFLSLLQKLGSGPFRSF